MTGNHVPGVLLLEVFGPRGTMETVEEIADTLRDSFSRVTVGAAKFFAPGAPDVVDDMSLNRAAKWNRVEVQCPFEVVET